MQVLFKEYLVSSTFTKVLIATAIGSLLAGCGSNQQKEKANQQGFFQDKLTKYQQSQVLPPLQVPQHLQATTSNLENIYPVTNVDKTGSKSEQYSRAPRPAFFYAEVGNDEVYMNRADGEKYISVADAPAQVWPRMLQYFEYNGIKLDKKDPADGVMETQWLVRDDNAPGFVDNLLSYIYLTSDQRNADKLRVELRPIDGGRTEIRVKHYAVNIKEYESGKAVADWSKPDSTLSYKNQVMYEILSYLSSAKDEQSAISYLDQQRKQKEDHQALMGQNERGYPVLQIQTGMDSAWESLNSALSRANFDVGTRDRDTGIFYLTYTTTLQMQEHKKGFFEWLHSDKEPITLSSDTIGKILGVSSDGKKKVVKYSSQANENPDAAISKDDALAQMDGYKIWLGGRVIYVFRKGQDNVGFWDKQSGTYKHTGRYQLRLSRTRQGVLVSVYTDKDTLATPEVAEEMLWKLKNQMIEVADKSASGS